MECKTCNVQWWSTQFITSSRRIVSTDFQTNYPCIVTDWLHVLGIVLLVVLSDLSQHLVDASLRQGFLWPVSIGSVYQMG